MEKNLFSGEELNLLENLEIIGGMHPTGEIPDGTNQYCPNFTCHTGGNCSAGIICS